MFKFFKSFFKKKKREVSEEDLSNSPEKETMDNKYDILIQYYDADGNVRQRTEEGVVASSPKELAGIYSNCQEKVVRILRVYPNSSGPRPDMADLEPMDPNIKLLPMPKAAKRPQTENGEENSVQQVTPVVSTGTPTKENYVHAGPPINKKKKTMYFQINGVDCKIEDEKVFQKQWVKLNIAELNNYRLISEKTNKIIPFNGKTLEILKWIQLDESSSEIANTIREITNA